jgi:hypothetical protein
MREGGLCAEDDYIQICLEGVSKIDTTKLSQFIADDWSVRTAYFFEITNKHDMKFEFSIGSFQISSQDGSRASIEQFIFFHDLRLPDGWQRPVESIPPKETARLFVIPENRGGDQKPESITYEQKLAEAWYDSIKSDPDTHITDYTGERINVKITPSTKDWGRIRNNMR